MKRSFLKAALILLALECAVCHMRPETSDAEKNQTDLPLPGWEYEPHSTAPRGWLKEL